MFTRHTADFATFVPAQNIATPAIDTPAALANATLDVSAHSLFETPHGWVAAHTLRPGDEVASLDGGFARLSSVSCLETDPAKMLFVPAGAIDNCTDMLLPASALIGVAVPDTCTQLNATYAAIPADALIGWHGIVRTQNSASERVILGFAEEEMIWTQSGALLTTITDDADTFFPVLSYAQARSLLPLIDAVNNQSEYTQAA